MNSCKNQDTVGLGVNSSGQISGILVDTSTVITNTVLEDSVITFPAQTQTGGALLKNPLAYFNDPIFGITESALATDLSLPGNATYTPPTGTIYIDSARLVLTFADGFYGDSLASIYTVNVYQLNEKFSSNINHYYSTKQWNYNSTNLLGSLTFNSRTHDSVKVFNIIAGKPDTLMNAAPQIRVPISTQFVNANLFNASATTLSSNTIFQNVMKGLYITLDKTKTTGSGGIFMISPSGGSLSVYYRADNGATIDTAVASFPVANFAAQIKHTYTATIQTELNNTTSSRGTIYLQGLAGLRTKISFPGLLANLRNNLLKKDSDIVINRAEIVVNVNPGTTIPFTPIPKLTMYRLDIAHQRGLVEDANTSIDPRAQGAAVFGGFYNTTTKQYNFIVTGYIQDLLFKNTVDYGTYIAPIDNTSTTSVDVNATPQVGSRAVAGGGANQASPYSIKLNIIYTKVAK